MKKFDLRSGSKRYRHFVGFFSVSFQAPTKGLPFLRLFQQTTPFSRLLRNAEDMEELCLILNPGVPMGDYTTQILIDLYIVYFKNFIKNLKDEIRSPWLLEIGDVLAYTFSFFFMYFQQKFPRAVHILPRTQKFFSWRHGPDPRPLWLLVGTPLVLRHEPTSIRAEHSLLWWMFLYIFDTLYTIFSTLHVCVIISMASPP